MSKIIWSLVATAAVLAILGGVYYQRISAEKWEQELLRRNVEVGGPGGPLPLGLWPGTPRKVALDAAQAESKGRFNAGSGQAAATVEVPGLRTSEEPCTVKLTFQSDRLLAVTIVFDSKSPVATNRLKLILEAKYGAPRKSQSGTTMFWQVETPPPYSITAGLIGSQLVVVYLDAGEIGRSANLDETREDIAKLAEKLSAAK